MPNAVVQLSEIQRKLSNRREAAAFSELIRQFKSIKYNLDGDIQAFLNEYEKLENPTVQQVRRMESFRRLIERSERELEDYAAYMRLELRNKAFEEEKAGSKDALAILAVAIVLGASGSKPLTRGVQAVAAKAQGQLRTSSAVEIVGEYLAPGSELFKRLGKLPNVTASTVAKAILDSVAAGKNPVTIGRMITKAFGLGLTDSLRMMRTMQLYAYRQANHENYRANGVDQWVWFADLGGACMACLSMHGTIHPNTETLNDHHNGKCRPLPVVAGNTWVDQSGKDYFDGLDEADKIKRMGKSKYEAYAGGKFEFDQLVGVRNDPVFGDMRFEESLKNILGEAE